jgi:hypothetical protein
MIVMKPEHGGIPPNQSFFEQFQSFKQAIFASWKNSQHLFAMFRV